MTSKTDVLDIKLGDQAGIGRKLKVKSVFSETVQFPDSHTGEKLILTFLTEDGEKEFKVSEAWSEKRGKREVQGLWINLDSKGNLIKNSTLGRLLDYLEIEKLGDLVGREITLYPDKNNYLVLTTFDMENYEDTKDNENNENSENIEENSIFD